MYYKIKKVTNLFLLKIFNLKLTTQQGYESTSISLTFQGNKSDEADELSLSNFVEQLVDEIIEVFKWY